VTQSGFVRVSSNKRVIPEARSPMEAILLLRQIVALKGHVFWSDDTALATSKLVAAERIVGHHQVSDAHLLALALRRGRSLVTFDRGVRSLASGTSADAALVLGGR
jgi:predicted nucleic acid-binding protein